MNGKQARRLRRQAADLMSPPRGDKGNSVLGYREVPGTARMTGADPLSGRPGVRTATVAMDPGSTRRVYKAAKRAGRAQA